LRSGRLFSLPDHRLPEIGVLRFYIVYLRFSVVVPEESPQLGSEAGNNISVVICESPI